MNYSVFVKVLQGTYNLRSVTLDFQLVKSLSSFQELIHTLVVTELKKDINIFAVFEEVHELSYILVFNRSVDLDFTHKLLLGSTPLKGGLLNYFSG